MTSAVKNLVNPSFLFNLNPSNRVQYVPGISSATRLLTLNTQRGMLVRCTNEVVKPSRLRSVGYGIAFLASLGRELHQLQRKYEKNSKPWSAIIL